MVEKTAGKGFEEIPSCPTPEHVPAPLMGEWLKYLADPESRVRSIPGTPKTNEPDNHFLYNPKIEDISAAVTHGARRDDPSAILRINGDRYKDGKRVNYLNVGHPDNEGKFRLLKIDFGWNGNDQFVARQIVINEKFESLQPVETGVYEAQFSADGRIVSYLTGKSTGPYGFQEPGSPHYDDYMAQLKETPCEP